MSEVPGSCSSCGQTVSGLAWERHHGRCCDCAIDDRPWDHPYDAAEGGRCVHCGWVGSYAHTEAFYRKWVWAADPNGVMA